MSAYFSKRVQKTGVRKIFLSVIFSAFFSVPAAFLKAEMTQINQPKKTEEEKIFKHLIHPLSDHRMRSMTKNQSWRKSCPVGFKDLTSVSIMYLNMAGKTRWGNIIVHRSIAKEVLAIFNEIHALGFRINTITPASEFKPGQFAAHNATAGFDCPKNTSKNFPAQAYGLALAINPVQNPSVTNIGSKKSVWPKQGASFLKKTISLNGPGMIRSGSTLIKLFARYGWQWGGHNPDKKNYMYFKKMYIAGYGPIQRIQPYPAQKKSVVPGYGLN